MQPYSLYLHIPFCKHRCAYCDFNTYAGIENLIPAYIAALCREIQLAGESALATFGRRLPVHTIFLGGGTPSLLPVRQLEKIFSKIFHIYNVTEDAEISLEANPGTLTLEYLRAMGSLGVNRLSLGMQSAHPGDLRILERIHTLEDVIQATQWARQASLENFNLDLIFGLPYQHFENWRDTLSMALSLRPAHLALYALTLEHGTPMEKWVNRGLLPTPDSDLAADMYDHATERLEKAGYAQYEISNWCTSPELACKHNLQYWRTNPWLGFGAGAHGYASGFRTVTALAPNAYIQRLEHALEPLPFPRTPATVELHPLSQEEERADYLMMGLRLVQEGISSQDFNFRFGQDLSKMFRKQINRLQRLGLLEWTSDQHIRLTRQGRLLGNRVFQEFI